MIAGDVLMFVVQGRVFEQVWQNVHFYQVDAISLPLNEGEFGDIVQAFGDWYQDNVHANADTMCTSGMAWDLVRGENLFNVAELSAYNWSPALIGAASGNALGTFAAYGFKCPSQRRGMNPGQRRLPGVPETFSGNFGAVEGTALTDGALVAAAFSSDVLLTYRGGLGELELRPVIVQRVRSGSGTPIDPYEYRLPRQTSERVTYSARNWSLADYVTTQNSRKIGRGI